MNISFLSETANPAMIDYMNSKGAVVLLPRDDRFDLRIGSHADLVLSMIDGTLILDENASKSIFHQLDALGVPYVIGNSRLSSDYPNDIAYNAVVTESSLIHRLDYTNSLLLQHSKNKGLQLISVRQGYTKCSTVTVGKESIITSDPGIYEATKDFMKVLLICPGHVLLEGFDSGFLGGASACFEDEVVFHGDLSKHPNYAEIKAFVEAEQKRLIYFKEFPLTDIGSVLVLRHQESVPAEHSTHRKHVNIPIFISHAGCPNDCVFCNQRKITAKATAMTLQEVSEQVNTYTSTLEEGTEIELAFFGGSFTGIATELQESYLKLAYEYKRAGRIHAIRLSTRPDYISRDILERLKRFEVDIIELGVQSLVKEVLEASNRGHQVSEVYQSVALIKAYGFQLGIQLMVGLPEDTKERSVLSSKLAALLKPDFVRIYPTLVIRETELASLCLHEKYHPLTIEEAVDWTKEMYQVFLNSQIPVIRMGLQPTDLITEGKEVLYGPFHPAFRQLVESAYFLEHMKASLSELTPVPVSNQDILFLCNPKDLSQVIGHKRRNILELKKDYPHLRVIPDQRIRPMKLELSLPLRCE